MWSPHALDVSDGKSRKGQQWPQHWREAALPGLGDSGATDHGTSSDYGNGGNSSEHVWASHTYRAGGELSFTASLQWEGGLSEYLSNQVKVMYIHSP